MKFTGTFKAFSMLVFYSAVSNAAPTSSAEDFYYLNWNSIDINSLPAPPKPGSKEDLADLQAVRDLIKIRQPFQCARAKVESSCKIDDYFGYPYGPLTTKELNLVRGLYRKVLEDTDTFVYGFKALWNRKRPYIRDPKIELCVNSHPATAYPSGHSAIAMATALVLGNVFPEHANALIRRAHTISFDRVVGGVHHPLDTKAGKLLGKKVFARLMENRQFNKDWTALYRASHSTRVRKAD